MEIDLRSGEVCLQHNQPVRLSDAHGLRVICTAGTIWITVPGETSDIFLNAGQSYRICCNQLALVESVGSGKIRLKNPPRISSLSEAFRAIQRTMLCQSGISLSEA